MHSSRWTKHWMHKQTRMPPESHAILFLFEIEKDGMKWKRGEKEGKNRKEKQRKARNDSHSNNMHQRDSGPNVGLIGSSLMVPDACVDSSGPSEDGAGCAGTWGGSGGGTGEAEGCEDMAGWRNSSWLGLAFCFSPSLELLPPARV